MNLKWIYLPVLLACLLIAPGRPGAAENRMNLGDCIETALKNQPQLHAASANLDAGKSREKQAFSRYLPQVAASTGYSESQQDGGAFGYTIMKRYSTSLSVNQTVYDFGRTGGTYDAARLSTRSAELDAERVKQDVILNVKQAYFDLLQAQRLVLLAQKTLDQSQSHLRQAEEFHRAGTKPVFDVTRAEVEVNSMRLGLINAENRLRINAMALNNAMGVDPEGRIEIHDSLEAWPAVPSLETVKTEALGNRPDLRKLDTDIAAADARIRAEEAQYLPTLALNGRYNWNDGTTEMEMLKEDVDNSWDAEIALSIPLYEGGLTASKVDEAKFNRQALRSQREILRQAILIEICRYYAEMESAKVRIDVMRHALRKAEENFAIARGRYEEGVGPYIDVTDARVSSVTAETDYVQSLYDFQLAAARLLNAMGKGGQLQGRVE
ncbi:MAG: TolC family protein [Thermodesulfobacteriota bacterium]